jgi:hypothetical protein
MEPVVGGGDGGVEELCSGAGQFGDAEDRSEVLGREGGLVVVGEVQAGEEGAFRGAAGLLRVARVQLAGGADAGLAAGVTRPVGRVRWPGPGGAR